jgi:hypothetical protein
VKAAYFCGGRNEQRAKGIKGRKMKKYEKRRHR